MSASTILAAIDTAIEAIVTGTASSVTVDGVAYNALSLDQLRALREYYAAEVARTAVASGQRQWAISPMQAGDGK